ncbi:MAG: PAS domain S-box protein [Polaromonas sp.]|uniref:PAS domain S-box protein n=1 Tax=Polaromonas sp. TaxID=1869339 RepID=UPI00271DE1E9|nr:PAS domain S-box protein [Polaromonas sp.]MDO9115280.1 PAS domain S-box protein [Polaromonas sp.]MDP1885476.1 PAS domain S-box protein [Polaromonas sp.]
MKLPIDNPDSWGSDPANAAALLAGVLNSAMDAIVTVDEQQRIVLYNRAAEEIFGWPRHAVLLQPLEKLLPGRFRPSHAEKVKRYGNTGVTSRRMGGRSVVYGLRASGEEFPLEVSISYLDTSEGKFFTAIVRDITEAERLRLQQVESYAQLLRTQRRLLEAQHLGRIGYWQLDLTTGLMWWCDESYDVLGVERALLDGTYEGLLRLIHPGDRAAFIATREAVVQAGLALDIEFRVVTSVGEVRWIHLLGRVDINGESGQRNRRAGMIQEITAHKLAELATARGAELLNRTGALAKVGGWEVDPETMAPYWSEEIYRICEMDAPTDLTLEKLTDFYAPEAQPVIRTAFMAALEEGAPWDLDLPLVTARGRRIWVRTQGRALLQDGKVVRLVGALQDITEIKGVENKLKFSNQELEAFSYSVSHDLRSPLNTIHGFSHLLAKQLGKHADEKSQHYLSRIQAGAMQMGQLIEGLLSLSQMLRVQLRSERVDLSMLARNSLDARQAFEPERQVTLHIESGLVAHGDERLLRVVMDNLLGNAWKFSGQRAQAEIRVGQTSDAAGEPVFFVCDNGAGFDMAYVDKLFEPFQRLHGVSEFPGTGIGLATVRRVIGRHGGRIWAESSPGIGACFFFTLPAASAGQQA